MKPLFFLLPATSGSLLDRVQAVVGFQEPLVRLRHWLWSHCRYFFSGLSGLFRQGQPHRYRRPRSQTSGGLPRFEAPFWRLHRSALRRCIANPTTGKLSRVRGDRFSRLPSDALLRCRRARLCQGREAPKGSLDRAERRHTLPIRGERSVVLILALFRRRSAGFGATRMLVRRSFVRRSRSRGASTAFEPSIECFFVDEHPPPDPHNRRRESEFSGVEDQPSKRAFIERRQFGRELRNGSKGLSVHDRSQVGC